MVPFPVVTGFTAAIGAIIAVQQLRDAFGLRLDHAPADFIERIGVYLQHADTVNPYAVAVTALTLLIVLLWPRVSHRIPSPFVALIVSERPGALPIATGVLIHSSYLILAARRAHFESHRSLDLEQQLREQRARFAHRSRSDARTGRANRGEFNEPRSLVVPQARSKELSSPSPSNV